jgi:hypothetical protein
MTSRVTKKEYDRLQDIYEEISEMVKEAKAICNKSDDNFLMNCLDAHCWKNFEWALNGHPGDASETSLFGAVGRICLDDDDDDYQREDYDEDILSEGQED